MRRRIRWWRAEATAGGYDAAALSLLPPLADPAEGKGVFGRRRERAADLAWEAGDDDGSGGGGDGFFLF